MSRHVKRCFPALVHFKHYLVLSINTQAPNGVTFMNPASRRIMSCATRHILTSIRGSILNWCPWSRSTFDTFRILYSSEESHREQPSWPGFPRIQPAVGSPGRGGRRFVVGHRCFTHVLPSCDENGGHRSAASRDSVEERLMNENGLASPWRCQVNSARRCLFRNTGRPYCPESVDQCEFTGIQVGPENVLQSLNDRRFPTAVG